MFLCQKAFGKGHSDPPPRKSGQKTAIWELAKQLSTDDARAVGLRLFLPEPGGAVRAHGPASLVERDHFVAELVHQGSDPTLPYQALVIRESARLFLGFAPCGP